METSGADTVDPGPRFTKGPYLGPVYDSFGYFDMFNNLFINDNSFRDSYGRVSL
jgi:hypothetical protein